MQLSIRQASSQDIDVVAEILRESARWLEEQGMPMWHKDELQPIRIVADVDSGQFFLAECDGVPAGAIRFQLEDRLFWPDVPQHDSAFIHRLAVRSVLPEEKFLRLSFFGPLLVHTHSVCAISVWIVKPRVRACEPSTSVSDFGFTATS
jgi:hypothetical protein